MRNFSRLLIATLFLLSGVASAQVYKCTDQSGTVSYTGSPCAGSLKSQQLTKIDTSPRSPPEGGRDWDKENQEFKQRQQARDAKDDAERHSRAMSAMAAATSNQRRIPGDQSLIAACEANHGVRCSDPYMVDKLRKENTPITRSEQQQAIGQRKARERDEDFDRAARR
jgi:hypothetical protein